MNNKTNVFGSILSFLFPCKILLTINNSFFVPSIEIKVSILTSYMVEQCLWNYFYFYCRKWISNTFHKTTRDKRANIICVFRWTDPSITCVHYIWLNRCTSYSWHNEHSTARSLYTLFRQLWDQRGARKGRIFNRKTLRAKID